MKTFIMSYVALFMCVAAAEKLPFLDALLNEGWTVVKVDNKRIIVQKAMPQDECKMFAYKTYSASFPTEKLIFKTGNGVWMVTRGDTTMACGNSGYAWFAFPKEEAYE